MQPFKLWFAYFDSILLQKLTSLPSSLSEMYEPVYSCKIAQKPQWPKNTQLEELVSCFQDFETFIQSQSTWGQSICTLEQLNKIEEDVNLVLNLLQIEKIYMKEFWYSDKKLRRMQASTTHLYTFFQLFIRAIIPYETMTMFQCKAAKKLSVNIKNLQELVRSLSDRLNNVFKFLDKQFFKEQKNLIHNFFTNFGFFLQNIPKIKKLKMFHVSELLKYVCLVNSIECVQLPLISRNLNFRNGYSSPRRKRSENIVVILKKSKSLQKIKREKPLQDIYITRRARTCVNLNNQKINIEEKVHKFHLRFKFPLWIRRHSIVRRKQTVKSRSNYPQYPKGKSNSDAIKSPGRSTETSNRRFTKSPSKYSSTSPLTKKNHQSKTSDRTKSKKNHFEIIGNGNQDQRSKQKIVKKNTNNEQSKHLQHLPITRTIVISLNSSEVQKQKTQKVKSCLQELIIKSKINRILSE